MARRKIVPLEFHQRDTTQVARELLGKILVRIDDQGRRISGRIVETEAYIGVDDRACHAFGERRTARTAPLYLVGGHSYVFLVYGMHYCFNVVTRERDNPQAVLIRALEPLEGIELMRERRKNPKREIDLTNGPGKLCLALGIDTRLDAHLLDKKPLFIEDDGTEIVDSKIIASPRIGVDYAGEAAAWPLRFSVEANPFVSKAPTVPPKQVRASSKKQTPRKTITR